MKIRAVVMIFEEVYTNLSLMLSFSLLVTVVVGAIALKGKFE